MRVMRGGRGGYVRGHAQYVGGTVIRFIWPCGHTRTEDMGKGPRVKRMGQAGAALMASWWSKEKGGLNLRPCRRCVKRIAK